MTSINAMEEIATLPFNSMPTPPEHWLTGSLGRFDMAQLHQFIATNVQTLGPIFKFRLLNRTLVVVAKPSTVQYVLKNRPERFRRLSNIESVLDEMGIRGVFSAEGKAWKRQRQLMNDAFRPNQIEKFIPLLQNLTQRLAEQVKFAPQAIDIRALLQRFALDAISNLAFGYDINALQHPDSELQQNLNVFFPALNDRLKAPFPYWRWIALPKDKRVGHALDYVQSRIADFIDAAQLELAADPEPKNILQAMIVAKDEEGESLSKPAIFGNIMSILMAGEDTVSNTLAWITHQLCDQKELQTLLYNEVQQHCSPAAPLSFARLDKCTLVNAVVHESMRLKPVAPFIYLENYNDEVLDGYVIPKGSMIVPLLASAGVDADVFPDPRRFDPSRWMNLDEVRSKKYTALMMHFGSGPRQCPGRQLSLLELKLALIELIRNFEFERNAKHPNVTEKFAFTLVPQNLVVDALPRS